MSFNRSVFGYGPHDQPSRGRDRGRRPCLSYLADLSHSRNPSSSSYGSNKYLEGRFHRSNQFGSPTGSPWSSRKHSSSDHSHQSNNSSSMSSFSPSKFYGQNYHSNQLNSAGSYSTLRKFYDSSNPFSRLSSCSTSFRDPRKRDEDHQPSGRFELQKIQNKHLPKPLHGTVVITPDLKKKVKPQRRTRAKVPEEPEILTLSSDDEDRKEEKTTSKNSALANKNKTILDAEAKAIGSSEEPDSSDEILRQRAGVEGGGMMEQAVDGSITHPHIMILCRTVRIGTFKEKPSDRVTLSPQGIEIKLPPLKNVTLPDFRITLKLAEIKKVLVSFSRSMPVLFIYLRSEGAARIRELLNMTDSNSSHFFDPQSHEETHKRITLLPEKLSEESKMILKHIFKDALTEINNSLANDILVKSSPRENSRHKPTAQSGEIKTIMVFPPPPSKGGISINTEDYACLGEDQFLNDVIIDFYLKYLMQSVLSDEDRERTHVFSSFFYKRLTSRPKTKGRRHPIEDDPKLSSAQKRHARVKGWTKNVNLFTKDFIIIPINESCHWFLAIICFPGQDGCRRMSDNALIEPPAPKRSCASASAAVAAAAAAAASTNAKLKVENNVMSIGSTTITPVKSAPATITLDHNGDEGSDRDEAEGDEEEMDEPASDEESQEGTNPAVEPAQIEKNEDREESSVAAVPENTSLKPKKSNDRDTIKQPCILIFDSLVGAPRYRVVATLRDYLTIEHKVKEGIDKEFTKFTIKGMLPKVPQQNNFTDCGLYVLQYVESFFKNPIKDYHYPIKELQDWFPEEVVNRKREEIVLLLKELMVQQNIDPNSLNLPALSFSHNAPSAQDEQKEPENPESSEMDVGQQADVAKIQSEHEAEDTEAAARLAASMQLEQQAENQEAVSGLLSAEGNMEDAEDSRMAVEDEETGGMPHAYKNHILHADAASQTINSALCSSAVSAGQVSVGGIDEHYSAVEPAHSTSLVDYSESSDECASDQLTVKRGTEQEDSIIDKKKRKCANDK